MKQRYTKHDYERILGMDLAESPLIRKKMEEAYRSVKADSRSGNNMGKRKSLRGLIMGMSAAVAALVLSMSLAVANPALAAKLTFIGNIFQTVGEDSGFSGNFEQGAVRLVEPGAAGEDGTADSPYVQTDHGITFTISECNYESMAMYLAVGIESEEGFSQELQNFARYGSCEETAESEMAVSHSTLYMDSTSEADFTASGKGIYEGNPAAGTSSPYYIEGKFVDDHTFAGIIRVDLMNMGIFDGAGIFNRIDNADLPDVFAYQLHVTDLYADPEGEHLSGNWDFALDVRLNREATVCKEVQDTNEDGIGIGTVTKTAYELYADPIIPEGADRWNYVVAVCDAEGKPLESQAEYAEIYSVYGRDVSKIYVYVVEETTYMDECKGNNYHNLPEKAVYQTEVVF